MDSQESPRPTNYQQVTVDVPEDRLAEFHAFFGRFLAGRSGRRRRGGHGGHHRGTHGRRCSERQDAAAPGEETTGPATGATEV
jgi:hypothetical protein